VPDRATTALFYSGVHVAEAFLYPAHSENHNERFRALRRRKRHEAASLLLILSVQSRAARYACPPPLSPPGGSTSWSIRLWLSYLEPCEQREDHRLMQSPLEPPVFFAGTRLRLPRPWRSGVERFSALKLQQNFRITHCDAEQRLCRASGLAPALLPVLQRPWRNTKESCEGGLRKAGPGSCLSGLRNLNLSSAGSLPAFHLPC